ncbi:MAG: radical SAM protein, partial [Puia sp.]|nr:radical SAM protein [Puia sp.]
MKASYLLYKLFNTDRTEFLDRVQSGYRHYIRNYPTMIVLQTVAACNLPCKHCFINNYGIEIPDGKKNIMKMEEFNRLLKRIEKAVKKADHMMFSSFEALLNKHLFEMMDAVLKINPRIKFPFLSNTMLMTDEVILELKKRPVTEINISVDGLYKETVEKFKTGVDYNQIIRTLTRLKEHGMMDKVAVTFVAHKDNIEELPDYVNFMNSLGVKKIYSNNLMSFTGLYTGKYLYTKDGNPHVEELFKETVSRVKKNKQQIWLPGLTPEVSGCTQPEMLFINYNGDVAPCDYLAVSTPFEYLGSKKTSKPVIFGNVLTEDVLDVYRSARAHAFRKKHRNNKLPGECDHCIDGYGLMCSKR